MIFVGREKELGILQKNFKRLDEGKSSVVLIDAEPGAGKTALVHYFLNSIPTSKFNVAIVNCDDKEGFTPYGAINKLYVQLQHLGVFSSKSFWKNGIQKLSGGISKDIIAAFVPGGNTVSSIIDVAAAFGNRRTPDKPIDEKQQLIEDICNRSFTKPFIIFWDDLQWIDAISANFIFNFCKWLRERKCPIFVIGTYRTHEINQLRGNSGRHPLADKINELRGYTRKEVHNADYNVFAEVQLPALKEDEVGQLVRLRFPQNSFPTDFITEHLYRSTQGNALFANSLLDLLVERGAIIMSNGNAELVEQSIGEIPRDIQGIIKERFDSLNEKIKRILSVASVNGYDFTIQIIERILKLEKGDLLDQLEEIERQHKLLIPAHRQNVRGKLQSTYRFTHALIHKYVYDNVSEEKRMYLHEQVADLLLELYGTKDEMPAEVSEQYENHLRISQGFVFNSDLRLTHFRKANEGKKEKLLETIVNYYQRYFKLLTEVKSDLQHQTSVREDFSNTLDGVLKAEIDTCEFFTNILEGKHFKLDMLYAHQDSVAFCLLAETCIAVLVAQKRYKDGCILGRKLVILFSQKGDKKRQAFVLLASGACYLRLNELSNALSLFTEAAKLYRQIDDKEQLAYCLSDIAFCYQKSENLSTAITFYNEAAELYKQLNEDNELAFSLSSIGLCHMGLKNCPAAIPFYIKAAELYRQIDDKSNLASRLSLIGLCHISSNEYLSALPFYSEASELYEQLKDEGNLANSLRGLGLCHKELGNYQRAIIFCAQAEELFRLIEDKMGLTFCLSTIGFCYFTLQEYTNAITYYSEAAEICRPLEDKHELAGLLTSVGFCYKETKAYPKAVYFYIQAIELYRLIGDKEELVACLGIVGSLYLEDNDYTSALPIYTEAAELYRLMEDKSNLAASLCNVGLCYQECKNYNLAVHFYTEAAQLHRELGDKRSLARLLFELGEYYILHKEYKSAFAVYSECLELYWQENDRVRLARCIAVVIWLCRLLDDKNNLAAYLSFAAHVSVTSETKNYENAISWYNEAAELYRLLADENKLAACFANIGFCLRDSNKHETAIVYYKKSADLFRQLSHEQNLALILSNVGFSYSQIGDIENAISCYQESCDIFARIDDQEKYLSALASLEELRKSRS